MKYLPLLLLTACVPSKAQKMNYCMHGALIAVQTMQNTSMTLTFDPAETYIQIESECKKVANE